MRASAKRRRRTRLGRDIEEAFLEMAAHLRGEGEVEGYTVSGAGLSPARIRAIRRKVASSTKEFEQLFGVPARTMETYEQGRRRPSKMAVVLLRIIDREPEAVRRALVGDRPRRAA